LKRVILPFTKGYGLKVRTLLSPFSATNTISHNLDAIPASPLPTKARPALVFKPKEEARRLTLSIINATEALEAATASLSVEAQERAAKDAKKKAAKAEAAEQKQADKIANSVVTIKRIERNKRKYVTSVSGLEAFGLELKKVAKDFGKKFATGSSVTKTPSGGEEIVVQGDVSGEIEEFLLEKYKDIPEDNIELVEDKKKKASAG
jgi:density-regulated protein DRP1